MRSAAIVTLLVIGSLLPAQSRASAAPLLALPLTVRVNVTGLGITYGIIGSSGTLTVTGADGALIYKGPRNALLRTNVRRIAEAGTELPSPRPGLAPDERAQRVALLREARLAAAEGTLAIVVVPFELSLLQRDDDDTGTLVLSGTIVIGTRFTTDDGYVKVNGRFYRGTFTAARDDEGDLIVVNTVGVADYLASVVGSEVPPSWHPEALASQAIAARTYLLTHLARHGAYDLEGDTRDQQYDGTKAEDPRTIRAVSGTSGLVATYRGAPIDALYSANAGGVTEDSENVFGIALPYLRSVPSPADVAALNSTWGRSGYVWVQEWTALQVRQLMLRRGIDIGIPRKIEILKASPTGRVLQARVTGTSGSRDALKDQSRTYFGLISGLFTVTLHETTEVERVEVKDADRLQRLVALGSEELSPSVSRVRDDDGRSVGLSVVAYRFQVPARFTFSGRGFGHGVGMSQWGAQGMATEGASYQQILRHYYTGIDFTNVGGG